MSKGRNVKELREQMGMNRREFCDYYGIPYRTVQDWESEKRELPNYLLRLLKYRAESGRMMKNKGDGLEKRKVNVIEDLDGKKTVFIHDILFKGKRSVNWDEVEIYLKQYVGEFYTIDDSNDVIFIGSDLPDEYAHSNYTHILRGANAKAKANAAQGLPELIEIAGGKVFTRNYKAKHNIDAMYGWYRYESRFALPVFSESGEIIRYNVFDVIMVVRHAKDGKMYLYDIMNIKKETSTLFLSEDITQ